MSLVLHGALLLLHARARRARSLPACVRLAAPATTRALCFSHRRDQLRGDLEAGKLAQVPADCLPSVELRAARRALCAQAQAGDESPDMPAKQPLQQPALVPAPPSAGPACRRLPPQRSRARLFVRAAPRSNSPRGSPPPPRRSGPARTPAPPSATLARAAVRPRRLQRRDPRRAAQQQPARQPSPPPRAARRPRPPRQRAAKIRPSSNAGVSSSWSYRHSRGDLSSRKRRKVVAWRKRSPCRWS